MSATNLLCPEREMRDAIVPFLASSPESYIFSEGLEYEMMRAVR